MKKIPLFIISFALSALFVLSAYAALPRLVDDADLLRSVEEDFVLEKLNSVSEEYGVDVVVVTVESTNGSDVRDYAESFYDNSGYGDDGILLLLCMDSRDYWFCTTGKGERVFTDSRLIAIEDKILGDLGEGRYYNAFSKFADACGDYLEGASAISYDDEYYDVYDGAYEEYEAYEKEPFDLLMAVLVSLGIGFLIAFIVVSVWKGQLNTVKFQPNASAYVKRDSLKLTQSNDTFLYHTVNRVPKVQHTSSGGGSMRSSSGGSRSSSGRSHGGRGGKF